MTRIIEEEEEEDPVIVEQRHMLGRTPVYGADVPGGEVIAASELIQVVVWSIVVLVLLAVGLYALHFYLGWF